MEIFRGQNLIEFGEQFKTEENSKEYLSNIKWEKGFKCVKCNHKASQIQKYFSITCNKCSHTETSSANTLLHKVKRMYTLKIENFSHRELKKIFTKNIDKSAKVATDLWKGYKPLIKDYKITQIESNNGHNFIALHTMIHQIKSWIKAIYSWLNDFNINKYLEEFYYRINHSISNIFNNLINRVFLSDKIYQTKLVCSNCLIQNKYL